MFLGQKEEDKDMFKVLIDKAIQSPTDTPPENSQEFDVYCDTEYNLYMFIKGEWTLTGLNIKSLDITT